MDTRMRHRLRRRIRAGRYGALLVLVLAGLSGLAALGVARAPRANAAGSDPIIHWDESMIYPGQNNGYPWGPVGELDRVHGEKFTGSSVLGQPMKLALLPGDVNNAPDSAYSFCKNAGPKVPLGQVTVDGAGSFDFSFSWPAAAGSGSYSICAYDTLDGFPTGNLDDGPFTVLSGSAPSVAVSRTTVPAGESITVTGSHWTPPQDVNVYIAACVDCDGPMVVSGTAHSSGLNTGSFSITFTIPATTTPGNYVAGANAHGVLDVGPSGGKQVAVTAAPVVTPTVAPTATTASQSTVSAGDTGGSGDTSDRGGVSGASPLLLVLAGVGVLLLLFVIAIAVILLSRRGTHPSSPGTASGPPSGWSGPGPASDGYAGYGDPIPPGYEPVQQNWHTLSPGRGEQVLPAMAYDAQQGESSTTRATASYMADPAAYPPAPPAYPPVMGDTPTQPGSYRETPPDPQSPRGPYGG